MSLVERIAIPLALSWPHVVGRFDQPRGFLSDCGAIGTAGYPLRDQQVSLPSVVVHDWLAGLPSVVGIGSALDLPIKRFVKVYADDDGELAFDSDVAIDDGVTKQFLKERISDWRFQFTHVLKYLLE